MWWEQERREEPAAADGRDEPALRCSVCLKTVKTLQLNSQLVAADAPAGGDQSLIEFFDLGVEMTVMQPSALR